MIDVSRSLRAARETGHLMKTLSASALSASLFGLASAARAGFVPGCLDGDIVRGNQEGAPGPICLLNNQFKHLEKVLFRFRVRDASGKLLDDKGLKGLVVELPDGQALEGYYGGHPPRAPVDYFWVAVWIIPADYPSGTLASYRAVATDIEGHTQTWEPIKRPDSYPVVLPGAIEFSKK
jgi:hypothetical protein